MPKWCCYHQGHDPDTFVQAEGRDALLAKVREAQPFIEFLLDAEADGHDLASVQGKLAYVRKLLPLIVNLGNQVERTEYLSELVKRTGVAPAALAAELHKLKPGAPASEPTAETHYFPRLGPERLLVQLLLLHRGLDSLCTGAIALRPCPGTESSGHSPSLVYVGSRHR